MTQWQFSSTPDDDHVVELMLDLNSDDATGQWNGTAAFRSVTYSVTGQWAAAGSVPGRKDSVFWFGGANADASMFIVAAGDLLLSQTPHMMQIAVTTASTADGADFGYNGKLVRTNDPGNEPDDPYE